MDREQKHGEDTGQPVDCALIHISDVADMVGGYRVVGGDIGDIYRFAMAAQNAEKKGIHLVLLGGGKFETLVTPQLGVVYVHYGKKFPFKRPEEEHERIFLANLCMQEMYTHRVPCSIIVVANDN